MTRLSLGLKRSHFLVIFSGRDHSEDKADQERTADENDEIGCKKGHNEPNGIVETVGGDKYEDSKKKKEGSQQREKNLCYPPQQV